MTRVTYDLFPGFEDVYLEDSYVLGIAQTSVSLSFALEVVLRESHPLYHEPAPGLQYFTLKAMLDFPDPETVRWLERRFVPATDATGEVDYGTIDLFYRDGPRYRLAGEWGDVEIVSAPPRLKFLE